MLRPACLVFLALVACDPAESSQPQSDTTMPDTIDDTAAAEDALADDTSVAEDSSADDTAAPEDALADDTSVAEDSSADDTSVAEDSSADDTSVAEDSRVDDTASGDATDLSGHWESMADVPHARQYPAAVVLDGRIWVLGGLDSIPLDTVEVYRPAQDSWITMPAMREQRYGHTAVVGHDGNVYVFGGQPSFASSSDGVSITAEMFDVVAGAWSALPELPTPRFRAKAAVLANGDIMLVGGQTYTEWPAETLIYRPSTRTWRTGPSLVTARSEFALAALSDGRIFVAGGFGNGYYLDSTEIYDPTDGFFGTAKAMSSKVSSMGAVDAGDGIVMLVGGQNDGYGHRSDVLAYHLAERTWETLDPLPAPRSDAAVVRTNDGRVWAVGGSERSGVYAFASKRLEVFTP